MRSSERGVLGMLLLSVICSFLAVSAAAASDTAKKVYLVQLADTPAIAYGGGVAGYPATKPAKGEKFDRDRGDVQRYVGYLKAKQDQVLAKVGGAKKGAAIVYVANGFSAALTEAQAEALRTTKGVVSVEEDVPLKIDTADTPAFLGLAGPAGVWSKLGGQENAGENVVIGVVDTGIWPENPSVADKKYKHFEPKLWKGKCQAGESFTAKDCNKKLIAAQWFAETQVLAGRGELADQFDFMSPRDANGHGTHTTTTAGGNGPVEVDGDAKAAGFTTVSGMAPRARLAMYKACFQDGDPTTGDCFQGDTAAALDAAASDGVDVINVSIGGTLDDYLNIVEIAFFNAAANGIFVATSAGNENVGAGPTVDHPSPWVTTVAAGTHPRYGEGSVTVTQGAASTTFSGASLTGSTSPARLVYSADSAVDASADGLNAARLCTLGSLQPVTGKVVLCERGVVDRTEKSLEVRNKGGAGMILVNPAPSSLNADLHFVPTVHVQSTEYASLKALAQSGTAKASFGRSQRTVVAAPFMAPFSSRGPNGAGGDLLKPDLTAPGVDVLAGYSPAPNTKRNYNFVSGTSMASPHVAGIAALLHQAHPDWSPMAIKSALMTTAYDVLDTFAPTAPTAGAPDQVDASADAARLFAQGAGHASPGQALDPGLVYDSGPADWIGFLCGTGQFDDPRWCPALEIDPSDLNVASIAIGDMAGSQTVTRTVTNVSGKPLSVTSSVGGLAGIDTVVTPASFTVATGATQQYTVRFTRNGAPLGQYQGGFLTWSGGGYTVRSPLSVNSVKLQAPAEVNGAGTSSSVMYTVKAGYSGNLSRSIRGLQVGAKHAHHVVADAACAFDQGDPDANVAAGNASVDTIELPGDGNYFRFQTLNAETDGHDDLDLLVYLANPDGSLVVDEGDPVILGASGGADATEVVNFPGGAAGLTVNVYVHGCGVDGPDANFTLFTWALTPTASNPFASVPTTSTVTIGQELSETFSWSGLPAGERYLGRVRYVETPPAVLASTVVAVSTR